MRRTLECNRINEKRRMGFQPNTWAATEDLAQWKWFLCEGVRVLYVHVCVCVKERQKESVSTGDCVTIAEMNSQADLWALRRSSFSGAKCFYELKSLYFDKKTNLCFQEGTSVFGHINALMIYSKIHYSETGYSAKQVPHFWLFGTIMLHSYCKYV